MQSLSRLFWRVLDPIAELSLEGIISLTIIVVGVLAWSLVSLWNMTGLSGELGMLVFWVVLAAVVIGVGGRVGWMIVKYIRYIIRGRKTPVAR
jgi:hypothetical protein